MSPWVAVLLFLIVGILFTAGGIGTARLIQPRKASDEKLEVYECGVDTIGPTWVQFRTSYFLYALLFLIFDVEAKITLSENNSYWDINISENKDYGFWSVVYPAFSPLDTENN
ncbi:MAG: NADH-quinone oxidoreductase subunit A, partial [Clostridia bacterium]|nr:NADH-quinone oxidoreductase subunit A [Clostridia bacterium]